MKDLLIFENEKSTIICSKGKEFNNIVKKARKKNIGEFVQKNESGFKTMIH